MMRYILVLFIGFITASAVAQSDMDLLLKEYNKRTVPYISVDQLHQNLKNYLIFDTRKKAEYDVSHLPGAIWVSEKMNEEVYAFAKAKKETPIVVYCTVGIRSEDFGEQLQKAGFSQVKNLYGSIFAWKDAGYKILNSREQPTDSVHVFSKVWGDYLKTGVKIADRPSHE